MAFQSKSRIGKYCSIVGAHFITAPLTFLWTFGNLSTYMDSYFRFGCSSSCNDGDSVWILGITTVTFCPGILLTKLFVDKIGLKRTGVAASIILSAALFGSAWTVQKSAIETAALVGITMGLGQGVTMVVAFQIVGTWGPENATLFIASTTVVPTLLSMVENQVITAMANPKNLKPDAMQDSRTFFSQPEILNRVPTVLIMYAAMTSCLQVFGFLLISFPPKKEALTSPSKESQIESNEKSSERADDGGNADNAVSNRVLKMTNQENKKYYGAHACSSVCDISDSEAVVKKETTKGTRRVNDMSKSPSLRPSEILKRLTFYALFLYAVANVYSLIIKANYYKQFALLYIQDDRYLTLIGTLLPAVAAGSRLAIGAALNKRLISTKNAIIFCLPINSILCAFWYFVPQVNSVLYLFFILGLGLVQGAYFVIIPVACLELFGPAYFSTNYGLLITSLCFTGLLSPMVVYFILQTLGWFWVFESASILCLITLVLVICTDFRPVCISDVD